ncbi:MAG: DUF1338 family protein [Actinobacteria bacterium]|nr:DUF1338 family protein [Actinomycetota bacterium]
MLAELVQASNPRRAHLPNTHAEIVATPFVEETVQGANRVPRFVIAHALNLALFSDLLRRVPSGQAYVSAQASAGRQIMLDHGAVRTVEWPTASAVPPGIEQVSRVLEPLGYSRRETYPLTKLRMTGYSYAHDDMSDDVSQWFVSELHPDEFSSEFRQAVERVIGTSIDPIDQATAERLDELADEQSIAENDAVALMPVLFSCFSRLHEVPLDTDYELLRSESPEMAWIATEGTAFNHATDRVEDVAATADSERSAGRPIKETVEVSGSGRVRQTAHRATLVDRSFRTSEGSTVSRQVPGSFFEFIDRQPLPDGSGIDLAFDASNAQGIFAMTSAPTDPVANSESPGLP